MKRARGFVLVILALGTLVLPACGPGEETDEAERAAAEQAERLDEALGEIEDLKLRTQELEDELAVIEDDRQAKAADLDRVSERLWASLAKLRGALADAKASVDSASSEASSALANAGAAAREVTILENRFEYHLRQHGGG
jgi:uncharacterized protein YoxC